MHLSESNPVLLAVQVGIAVLTALGTGLLAWKNTSKFDHFDESIQGSLRFVAPVLVAIVASFLWIIFFDRCEWIIYLAAGAVAAIILAAGMWLWYDQVKDAHTVVATREGPDGPELVRIVKGRELTDQAKERLAYDKKLVDRDLLQIFDHVADRVWPRPSRAAKKTLLAILNLTATVLVCSAIMLMILPISLLVEQTIDHKPLAILTKPTDCPSLRPNAVCQIDVEIKECRLGYTWAIIPSGLGKFVGQDVYQAPADIKRLQQVTLIATPEHQKDSARRLTLELVPEDSRVEKRDAGPLEGPPSDGRPSKNKGYVEALLISAEHSWLCGSDHLLKGDTNGPDLIQGIAMREFSRYSSIVTFGAASREGAVDEEYSRAAVRAVTLGRWVDGALKNTKPVFIANLGRYDPKLTSRSTCPGSPTAPDPTAGERRLIIVGIKNSEPIPAPELTLRLKNTLQRDAAEKDVFRLILDRYSTNWELVQYRPR
jgi:hypothetical protein